MTINNKYMTVFIGLHTEREKSAQLKINEELSQHILDQAERITRGPHGELLRAALNGHLRLVLENLRMAVCYSRTGNLMP